MINILTIVDDERRKRVLCDFLNKENFNVITSSDCFEAKEVFTEKHEMLQLVIIDVKNQPLEESDLLSHIKETDNTVPVMMLVKKGQKTVTASDILSAADEYMVKPLSPIVLIARIKTLIKKSIEMQLYSKHDYNGLVIDETGHGIYSKNNLIDFTPKEYDLLVYLAKNEGIALSREQIISTVWGYDYSGDMRTLDAHIKNIRAKLGDKSSFIKTTRGYGYKFQP